MPTLLSLTTELLIQILFELLIWDHHLWIRDNSPCFPPSRFKTLSLPPHGAALLCVNRRLHSLAANILYGHNTFSVMEGESFGQPEFVAPWLRSIGPINAASITHLSVNFPGLKGGYQSDEKVQLLDKGKDKLETILQMCKSLKVLQLHVERLLVELLERTCRRKTGGREVLIEIDRYLRRIGMLERIEVDGCLLKSGTVGHAWCLRREMRRLGWVFLAMDLDEIELSEVRRTEELDCYVVD